MERDLSFREGEAFQSPLVLVVDLCASYVGAWDEVASEEIAVSEVEAFLEDAGVGSDQVGPQEDQWMVPGAQLQDQVQLLEYQEVKQAGLQEGWADSWVQQVAQQSHTFSHCHQTRRFL